MTLSLHTVKPAHGSKRRKKRLGRGNASGHGTYSTRGIKGQRARTGGRNKLKYLGLKQIMQNIPKKRGFKSLHPTVYSVNLSVLEKHFADGDLINPKALCNKRIIADTKTRVKILGGDGLSKKFKIRAHAFSQSALESIKKVGGSAEFLKNI